MRLRLEPFEMAAHIFKSLILSVDCCRTKVDGAGHQGFFESNPSFAPCQSPRQVKRSQKEEQLGLELIMKFSRRRYPLQFRVMKRDGLTRWIDSRGTMAGEGSSRMIGIEIDITKLRSAEADYRSMVETAPYGIFRSTLDGRFLVVNPSLIKMLGYDCESELLSLNIEGDMYCNPGERAQLVSEIIETGYIKEFEAEGKRKDGSTITVQCSSGYVNKAAKSKQFKGSFKT